MKLFRPFLRFLSILAGLLIFIASTANATTYYSFGNAAPNTLGSWHTTMAGGGSNPTVWTNTADIFIVQSGCTYTSTAAWTISGSVQVLSGGTLATGATSTWTMSIGGTTTVAGTLTLANTGTKTFTGDIVINNGGIWNETGIAAINFGGSLQNDGAFTANTGVHTFSGAGEATSGANAIAIPSLTISAAISNNGTLTVSTTLAGASTLTNSATGTLNYGGSTTIAPTLTATAAGNTVNYTRAGIQTVKPTTYSNLTLSGSGAKTTTTVTVNGILTMAGTASVTAVPTYGASSTLYYDGSAAQTTGTEFPTPFTGTGGVVSNNPLGVTMNAIKTVSKLTVNAGASFSTGATNTWTLTVSGTTSISGTLNITNTATKTFTGDVTVFSGGNMLVSSTSKLVQTNNLIVNSGGTLTHNQVYDNASTILEVLGNLDINGTYTYTGFTPAVIMDAASGTFNINAQNTSLYQLFLKNAIFKCTGDLTVNNQFYAMWNLDAGEFHTNGFDVTATTWGMVNAGGTVFVDGGSLTLGGAVGGLLTGHTGPTGANGHVNVSSGTFTTTGLYAGIAPGAFTFASTVTQSGGTVNVNGPIVIDGSTTASKYLMSGGTLNANGGININSPAVFTCTNSPIINVGGSWINTGTFTPATSTVTFNGAGNQTLSNSSATSFYNLISNPSAGVTVNVAGNNISIVNNLTVSAGTFDISTFTANQSVAAGTFNLGSGTTLKLAGANNFPTGYSTVNLNPLAVPTSTVEYNGTIGQSILNTPTYGNLTVSNNSTKLAAGALTVKGDLNINTSAVFSGSTFSHTITGNWYNNVSTAGYTGGSSTVTFNGSAGQVIGGTAGTIFNNLSVSDAGGISISQDQTVNSTLTLTAGNFNIGTRNLIFGSSAAAVAGGPFSATKMIIADGGGEVRKDYSAIGSFLFPIGDNTGTGEYSPITLNYTAGSFAGGAYAGVAVTDAKHPNNASSTDYLTRYWTTSNSGITSPSFTATATYLTADIAGTEANIAAAEFNVAIPWVKYGVLGSNTLTTTAVTNTGTGIIFSGITNKVCNVSITGGGVAICNGGSVSLGSTVTNNGTGSVTYAWTPTGSLSSSTVSNPTATPTSTTTYSLVVTDGNGIPSSAATSTITVNPVSVGGTVSGGAAVCSGTNSGTLTLSGQTGSVIRWEYSTDGGTTWTPIVNTTTSQTYTNLTVATLYRAVVQSGVCASANSVSASMTINAVSVGGTVSGGAAVCSGTNSGTLTLSGQTGSVIRWEYSTDGGTTWTPIVNTTTSQTYTNLTVATLYRAVVQSGVCASANSVSASMTINAVSVGGTVSGGAAVCSGTNSGTLTLSGQTGSVIRWEYSTDGGTTWTTIVNTTTSQAYTNLTVATLYRAVVQSGVCASANSVSASMTINAVSVGGTVSGGAAVCSGTNSGTLTLSGQTGSVIRWEYSTDGGTTWTTIVNTTTSQTYTNLTVATLYRAVVQSGVCASANSASASMTINAVSVGGTVSGGAAVCSGTNSGTLTLSGQTGSVIRWEYSTDGGTTWTPIVNTTTSQTYTNLTVATLYRAVVQSGVCASANSASASMTINAVSVGGTVSGGAAVCSGTNSGTLTLSGQTGSVIRWEYSTDGGTTWTTIVNTTTSQTYTNLTVATLYRAVVQSGVCASANSASASMTINAVSVGGTVSGGAAVCSGTNSGTLTLSGQTGSVIRWEYSTDGGTTWTPIVNTTTSQTYTNLTVATLYRAVVQSGVCASANSVSASMTINAVSVGGTVSGGAAVCSGTNSGTLTLSGQTGSVIRWEYSTNGGTTWTPIVNTTTSQTYTNLTVATLYRAVVQSGVCASANSASASMTINAVSVGGTVSGGAAVCSGTNSGTLTLSGQTGSVIRWEYSTDGGTTWTPIVNTTTSQTYTNLTVATLYRAVVQSGVCASANSVSASMTINAVSVGGTVSGGAAVCSGTNSGTLTLSGQTGSVIRWEYSTDGGTTWTPIVNTTTSQTYTNLTVATLYRAVVQSGVCASANSVSASMTINAVSVGGTVSGGAAVCSGTNSGTLTLSGQTGSVIRWEYSTNGGTTWTPIVNTTTSQTYTNLTVATLYRAVVQSGVCASANSASASMTINAVSVGGTVSGGAAVCSGTNSGTLTLSGQTGSVIRWEYSTDGGTTWTPIVNTTTSQTYTNLTVATLYRAVVQSGVCASANSVSASMTINAVSVGGTVSGGAAVCSGTNSGTLTLSGQTGSVIRWEYSTDGGTTWTPIVNTTTSQTYTNLTVATLYRAVVQSGVCASANSASASMTINPVSVGGTVSGGAAVCSGTNSGTLTLSGQTGSVIRWEYSTDGGTTWTPIVNTTTSQTYTNLTVATLYRAVVQSGVCASANSASASMTINAVSVGGTVSGGAAVCSGTNSGTLTLSGQTGSVIRWEYSTDGGTTWTPIVNTTTSQTYTNLTVATLYRAVVQSGVCASANSASASMTINAVSVGGTVSGGAAVCSGTNSGTLTLSGQTGSVIRWEYSTDGGTTWTPIVNTTTSQTYTNLTVATLYRAVVQSGVCASANSASASMTINPTSVGGTVSGGAAVCSGTNSGTLTLSGQTGSVIRWEYSTDGGTTWTPIVNTTTSQTYTNLTVATLYRAVVQSGVCASANSVSASMTINAVSVGGTVSGGAAVCSGTNSGTLTLSGQTGSVIRWEYSTNGGTTWTPIVNTTTSQTYTNLTVATLYRAVVQSGVCASANSASASMTINAVSVGGTVSGGAAVCSGTNSGTLTLSGQTGSVIRWEYSTDGGTTWTPIVNTTTSQTYTNLTVATLYRAVVQSGVCASANSVSASMTINAVSVGGTVSGGAAVCSGTNSGTLTLSGQTGSVIRWEYSTDGGTTWTPIVNTTTSQTYTNLTVATLYRAVVQSGVCASANSVSASMTINAVSVGGTVSGGAAVCSGTNSGTLTLSGQTGSVIRWEYSTNGGTTWTPIVNTTTSQTYTNLTVATLYRAVVQSGVCASANSASASMTINAVSVGGTVSGGAAVCSGTNSGTLTLSGQTGSVIRWEYSTDGGTTWTPIVNTTTSQTYTNLTVATLYRAVVQSGVCASANSVSASMTINAVSVGGTVSGGAAVCSGTNSGTLTLSGQTGSVIRWEYSTDGGTTWTPIVNTTTSQTYTNLTVATLYRAVVQSGVCASANSVSASMTINAVSVGGTVSGGAAVCSGTNSGTLTLSGQTGSVIRWEYSTDGGTTWTPIVNTTTSQTYTNLTVATLYRAVVQSGVCASANSASASMTINAVSVGGTVSGGAAVCSGTNSGTLTLSGQTGSVIRWEYSTDGGTTWTTIVNTTTSQAYINLTVATLYRAVVQSGVCASANSVSASMTINAVSVGGTVSGGAAVCSGTNSGTLTLSGQTGSVIRWEYSTDGGTTWTPIVNTTTSQTYTNLTVATLYRAVVQSGVCASANSVSASMTINAVSVGGTVSGGAAVCSGTNSGTLTLSGQTGSVIRWEYSTDGGTTWTPIVNTTTSQTYTNLTVATLYRAVVQSGVCASANSASASMTINAVSVGGTVSGGAAVCSGTNSGTLTLSGQTGSVIRWEYSTDGGTTWTPIVNTTTSQTYTNLTVATLYRAVVQSGVCASANSASASMTINAVSVGGTVSGGAAVCSGTNSGTLTLSGQTGSVIRWEYSTDGGTTWTPIVNTTTSQTYTNLTVATLYRAVVQSGVCASANSASASMTITISPSATISYAGSPFCSNIGVAPVTFSGSAGGTYSILPAGGVINPVNGTVDLVASSPGLYTITYTVAAFGGCSIYTTTASIVINPNTWTGGISSDWNTPGNWAANAVPTLSCPDVTILSGMPYQPTLGSGTFAIDNLYIKPGAYLTVTNATLQISGTINNSGTFDVSNGTIEMNGGSTQTIPANAFQNNALKDLIISNTSAGGVSLGGALDIYNSLTFSGTGMKFTTNDSLTFKSTAANTAWLGDMTGNTITGKATVERYISNRKAWRFLSIPTNTTQTIRQTWQEGATSTGSNPVAGYGIQVTGAGGTAAGFDAYSSAPSMKTYNYTTGAWVGISSTANTIKATDGYMTFIRGDRTVNSVSLPPTQTTLRTKGLLYTGNQTPIVVGAGKWTAIGNPFASAIDMRNITKNGVKDFFYVWDPAMAGANGYGAYQTFSNDGSGNYVITPGGGSYGASGSISNYIQSGQAFFVQGDVVGGSLTFKEGAKTTGSGVVSIAALMPTPELQANLYGVNADKSTYITDGLLINYDDGYSNNVDDLDAIKSTNGSENLSVKTANKLLVVERRHTITDKDTIFLNLTGVSARKYRFEFLANDLYKPGLTAFLEDNYLHTRTPLYVDGTTDADFVVTSTAASYAANRFRIVFSQLGTLPVTFTSVKAYSNNNNINVEWKVDNEMNIKQYETEKSADGNKFTTLAVTAATANGGHSASYLVTDTHPVEGYNYYRVKSIDDNGAIAYSNVVKVLTESLKQDISIYPNPITDGIIHLQLNNQPAGEYGIRLLDGDGKIIVDKQINHAAGSSSETIQWNYEMAHSIYQLEVIKPDGSAKIIKVLY